MRERDRKMTDELARRIVFAMVCLTRYPDEDDTQEVKDDREFIRAAYTKIEASENPLPSPLCLARMDWLKALPLKETT